MIILLLTTFAGTSQIINKDTITCLPNSQLRSVIKEIEKSKIIKEELDFTKTSVSILQNRIKIKDSVIGIYIIKDSLYEKRNLNSELAIQNLNKQIENHKQIDSVYKNIVRKQKIVNMIGGAVAGFVLGLVTFIIVK